LIFQSKTRISQQFISHFIDIIARIFKKTLKNLPENQEIKFDIVKFLQICEEILVSDQKTLENSENKEKNRFLTSGILTFEEFRAISLLIKREIIRILTVFCEM